MKNIFCRQKDIFINTTIRNFKYQIKSQIKFFATLNFDITKKKANILGSKELYKQERLREKYFEIEKDKNEIPKNKEVFKLSPTKAIFGKLIEQTRKEREEFYNEKKVEPNHYLNKNESKEDPFRNRFKQHYFLNKEASNNRVLFDYTRLDEISDKLDDTESTGLNEIYNKEIEIAMQDKKFEERNFSEDLSKLVKELGYMDYRDYLALNKYAVDETLNDSILQKTKKKLLNIAFELVDQKQKAELLKQISTSEGKKVSNHSLGNYNELNQNIIYKNLGKREERFFNLDEAHELFEMYYTNLRAKSIKDDTENLNLAQKMEELKKLETKKNKTYDEYNYLGSVPIRDPILDNEEFGFNSEVDQLIRDYRRLRLKPLKYEAENIIRIVSNIFNLKKEQDFKYKEQEMSEEDKKFLDIKYQVDENLNRLKEKVQIKTATDEIEELIVTGQVQIETSGKKKGKDGKDQGASTTKSDFISKKKTYRGSYSSIRRSKPKGVKYLGRTPVDKRVDIKEEIIHGTTNKDELDKIDYYGREKEFSNLNKGVPLENKHLIENQHLKKMKLLNIDEMYYNKNKEEIILLMKYLIIIEKLGVSSIYKPTNYETEKKIYAYLREKLEQKKFDFEQSNIRDDLLNDPFLNSLKLQQKDFKDNLELEKIKENYISSKSNFERKRLLEKFDKLYANQFGFQFADEKFNKLFTKNSIYNEDHVQVRINQKTYPVFYKLENYEDFYKHKSLIEEVVKNYYRQYKLDYMYNRMEYYTDKYKIRRRIMDATAQKYGIKEINNLITKMAENIAKKNDLNEKLKFNLFDLNSSLGEKSDKNSKDNKNIISNFSKLFKFLETGKDPLKPVLPKIIEERLQDNHAFMGNNDRVKVYDEMKKTEDNITTNSNDRFELEVYCSLKRDPFYTHYLNNYLSFQADYRNNFKEVSNFKFKERGMVHSSLNMYDHIEESNSTDMILKKLNNFSENDIERYYNLAQKLKNNENYEVENIEESSEQLVKRKATIDEIFKEKGNFCYQGFGKRKTAKAWVVMTPGTGVITINRKPLNHYFRDPIYRAKMFLPFKFANIYSRVDLKIILYGGGLTGQSDALIPAISKCLIKFNPDWEQKIVDSLYVVHDPRNVERKKPGLQKARKGQVYRRR